MKQYFTGFITAASLTASIFILMGSQDKNWENIHAKSITLVNEDGIEIMLLGSSNGDGILQINDAEGNKKISLCNGIEIFGEKLRPLIKLGYKNNTSPFKPFFSDYGLTIYGKSLAPSYAEYYGYPIITLGYDLTEEGGSLFLNDDKNARSGNYLSWRK